MEPDEDEPEDGDDESEGSERFVDLFGSARPVDHGSKPVLPPAPPASRTRPRPPARSATRETTDPFRRPDPDQPRLAAADGVSDALLGRLTRGEIAPEERIDLHGLRTDAAGAVLSTRISAARRRGLRCVVVIHGSGRRSPDGGSVLRTRLPEWLVAAGCAPHVLAFAPAPPRLGGDGATLVLLRRQP